MLEYTIKLNCGHNLALASYYKISTYSALLEGELSLADSVRMFEESLRICAKLWPGYPVANIYKGGDYPLVDGILAPVITVAQFWSFNPVKDDAKHASSAVLAWLEDRPDVLISERNKEIIRVIDWKLLASDYDW